MKKAFTQTIIVFVAISLITAGFALAREEPNDLMVENPDTQAKKADIAEKEMAVAEKQMKTAEKQMFIAKDLMAMTMYDEMLVNPRATSVTIPHLPRLQHSGSGAVLVIPTAQMKIENLAAITEDMTVMSRILDKKLSQASLITGGSWFVGIDPLSFGRGNGATEAIYLEGYGALFLMKVNLLLSPQPEAQQEKETKEEDTDPLWTQMRQEMYAPEEARTRKTARSEEKYDAEKVEEMKETIIKTLKHAANIRALKPDELVILTIIGKAGRSAGVTIKAITRRGEYLIQDKDKRTTSIVQAPSLSDIGFSSLTVLTIRAKKSDIDDFAKGKLDFDQFQKKIQMFTYSYLGGNISGELPTPTNVEIYDSQPSSRRRISSDRRGDL